MKLLFFGTGISNIEAIHFIDKFYPEDKELIVVSDSKDELLEEKLKGVNYTFHLTSEVLLSGLVPDYIIKSPGISPSHPLLEKYKDVKTINDIEISYLAARKRGIKIIGVTGTNGKTSTVMLIQKVLSRAGFKVYSCGNIGISPLKVLSQESEIDYLIYELSSFQLLNIDKFSPDIALILNIAPDHIDYHGTFGDYINAKCNLIKNLEYTKLIISGYPQLPTTASVHYVNEGINNYNNSISEINVAIISELLAYLQIDQTILSDILKKHQFILPHRYEYIDTINGVDYINDSKATNVQATINAIEQNKNIILIVGGKDKGEDLSVLGNFLTNVKQVIAYGENKLGFKFAPGLILTNTLQEATEAATLIAQPGDTVLLSPASASLDQFKNFEERGNKFRKYVKKIKDSK